MRWAELGLAPAGRIRPIAWKADALAVSLRGTDLLHAPVAHSTVSRHVVDGNRDLRAADLAPRAPEHREIPGSAASTDTDRRWRLASVHPPVEFALEYGKR